MLDNATCSEESTTTRKAFFQKKLAEAFDLSENDLFGRDMTLAEVIAASAKCVNSVDFMEGVAKVANAYRKLHGVSIRLPATSLDTRISVIVDSFAIQAGDGAGSTTSSARGDEQIP